MERVHENPFDPLGEKIAPIELFLSSTSNKIELNWKLKQIENHTGFRIYRAKSDSINFERIAEVASNIFKFTDNAVNRKEWYSYCVTVLGVNVESNPSNIEKVLIGPGEPWILSFYGYTMVKYSYDLKRKMQSYRLRSAPLSWSWRPDNKYIYLNYPAYGEVSRFNIITGMEDDIMDSSLIRPLDLKWNQSISKLCVLDDLKQSIFIFSNSTLEDSISLSGDSFSKLETTQKGNIWVIGEKKVMAFNKQGILFFQLAFEAGFEGKDMIAVENMVFILLNNVTTGYSRIIQYLEEDNSYSIMNFPGNFKLIRKLKSSTNFWLCEVYSDKSEGLVKLSFYGSRLLEILNLGHICDFQINHEDKSILTVDRYQNSVSLIDSLGHQVSKNQDIFDPIKVYIQ